jgi:hypothetical protein
MRRRGPKRAPAGRLAQLLTIPPCQTQRRTRTGLCCPPQNSLNCYISEIPCQTKPVAARGLSKSTRGPLPARGKRAAEHGQKKRHRQGANPCSAHLDRRLLHLLLHLLLPHLLLKLLESLGPLPPRALLRVGCIGVGGRHVATRGVTDQAPAPLPARLQVQAAPPPKREPPTRSSCSFSALRCIAASCRSSWPPPPPPSSLARASARAASTRCRVAAALAAASAPRR